jgi:hypothetical protein
MATTLAESAVAAIVLVHGGFVDGSGWEDVYEILKEDGCNVGILHLYLPAALFDRLSNDFNLPVAPAWNRRTGLSQRARLAS